MFSQIIPAINLKFSLGPSLRDYFTWASSPSVTRADTDDAELPDRLRYDIGLSDLNPDTRRGRHGGRPDVSREMLRRMY